MLLNLNLLMRIIMHKEVGIGGGIIIMAEFQPFPWFKSCVNVALGTWFNGGHDSSGGMVGLNDLRRLFPPKKFCKFLGVLYSGCESIPWLHKLCVSCHPHWFITHSLHHTKANNPSMGILSFRRCLEFFFFKNSSAGFSSIRKWDSIRLF